MARLSSKGSQAFTDVALARAAIFNGHTTEARKLITAAQADLTSAAKDDTAVTKAESQLTAPPGATVPQSKSTSASPPSPGYLSVQTSRLRMISVRSPSKPPRWHQRTRNWERGSASTRCKPSS
ncbi:YfdX family protein [Paraburkholderia terrae]|uniref:YfdX family protein n=1 Tax=Paraburkholderia terrae TaxID=311230 RepID=UPI003B846A2F